MLIEAEERRLPVVREQAAAEPFAGEEALPALAHDGDAEKRGGLRLHAGKDLAE